MQDQGQQQVVMDLGGSIASQLRNLLTDQFWVVVGFVALGMVFGIATAGGARLFRYRLDDDLPSREYARRALALKRIAYAAGTAWTLLILPVVLEGAVAIRLLLAIGLAPIAGLGTPHMYDLLRWTVYKLFPAVGHWLLDRVRTMLSKE